MITTADVERRCVTPTGLQQAIDDLVSLVPNGRSFVRSVKTSERYCKIYACVVDTCTCSYCIVVALYLLQPVYAHSYILIIVHCMYYILYMYFVDHQVPRTSSEYMLKRNHRYRQKYSTVKLLLH